MTDQLPIKIAEFIQSSTDDYSVQKLHLSGSGFVNEFEQKLADFYQKKYCITFSNATSALTALALALELKGKKILVPEYAWENCFSPFNLVGAEMVYSPADSETLNVFPELTELHCNKLKAFLAVDTGGYAIDAGQIRTFCDINKLHYIHDASQSMGAFYQNKPSGYFADSIVTSFTAGKTLFTGEGGAVMTDSVGLHEQLIHISQHYDRRRQLISERVTGNLLNGRINPMAAIVGSCQFDESLNKMKEKQVLIHSSIKSILEKYPFFSAPVLSASDESTYFEIPFRINYKSENQRKIEKALAEWYKNSKGLLRFTEHHNIRYMMVRREWFLID